MIARAVITADIVNSTGLSKSGSRKLIKNLESILQSHKHEFYRGDSFQVFVKSPAEALLVLLRTRAAAMKLLPEISIPVTDIRACIGIGRVKLPIKSLQAATDEAFVLSGRAFDKMKSGQRLLITCSEKNYKVKLGLNVIAHFLDYIFQRLTSKQAAVVFELLMDRTQVDVAKRLKKTQATVNQQAQSGGWAEIEKLLSEYQLLINAIEI